MADLNSVSIVGRLGADPELRHTQSGTAVADLNVAINGRKKDDPPTWVTVTAWGRTAEIAAEYLHKGSLVGISGRLTEDVWQAQDGSNRRKLKVTANELMLMPRGDGGGNGGGGGGSRQSAPRDSDDLAPAGAPSGGGGGASTWDDDIPF